MWEELALFIAVGFGAQLVDGALGMAYGLTSTSVLLSAGIPPAIASASVHAAEVFTTGISGIAHWRHGNVRWRLVWKLALPGMLGGAAGAYLLASVSGDFVKPLVSIYLGLLGAWIILKALRRRLATAEPPRWTGLLGAGGGFFDAIGGGGWGPIVTSTLLSHGTPPRYTIGSVNLTEFFVTLTISLTFLGTIGLELWPIIVGLILGGACAAPIAAMLVKRIPTRPLMFAVGIVIVALSTFNLFSSTT